LQRLEEIQVFTNAECECAGGLNLLEQLRSIPESAISFWLIWLDQAVPVPPLENVLLFSASRSGLIPRTKGGLRSDHP